MKNLLGWFCAFAVLAGSVGATDDTFDTDSVAAANLTFSNANLTVLAAPAAGGGLDSIGQAREGKKAGKWCVDFTLVASSGGNDVAGITDSSGIGWGSIGYLGPGAGYSWGWVTNGNIINSTSGQTHVNGGTYTVGDKIAVAIDLDNKKIWFAKNGVATWVGPSGTPNPSTNTSGIDITLLMANNEAIFPAVGMDTTTTKWTANFSNTACTGILPTGFTAGWTNTTAGTYFGSFLTQGTGGLTSGYGLGNPGPMGTKYVSTMTGALTSMVFTTVSSSSSLTAVGTIYDATGASGGPGALVGFSTNTITNPAHGEYTFTFSGVNVTSGTTYWVGLAASNTVSMSATTLTTGIYQGNTLYATSTHPNPFVIAGGTQTNGRAAFEMFVTPTVSSVCSIAITGAGPC